MATAQAVTVRAPNFQTAVFRIVGTAPYVQHKFSSRVRHEIMAKHAAGSTANKGKARKARDFDADYQEAMHVSREGWCGIPAPAFRNAMISACRTVGYKMTHAKMAVFIEADGFDPDDGTPLVKILEGKPEKHTGAARNETGVIDIRVRPLWQPGWKAEVRVKFDGDMFTPTDVANLLLRAGMQVGVGEGRPDSRNGPGVGWGTFTISEDAA